MSMRSGLNMEIVHDGIQTSDGTIDLSTSQELSSILTSLINRITIFYIFDWGVKRYILTEDIIYLDK